MKFKVGEIDEFKNLFKLYDQDGSGYVQNQKVEISVF